MGQRLGVVSTKLRTGTVRVHSGKREQIDKLTFEEIVGIVDGHVLGGQAGLPKTLNKFVIGAMQLEAMMAARTPVKASFVYVPVRNDGKKRV